MKEELITLETAILGEEKGFNYNPEYYFYPNDNRDGYNIIHKNHCFGGNTLKIEEHYLNGDYSLVIPAPTQSLLQRWLREVHNIHVEIKLLDFVDLSLEYHCKITFIKDDLWEWFIPTKNKSKLTYEEAIEIGIQEGLKLIKK